MIFFLNFLNLLCFWGLLFSLSDLNLDDDEDLKLACLVNEVNSKKEKIDILKKSSFIRNKDDLIVDYS